MFLNFFKSAFRNFIRSKFYSLLNVLGLSIGLAVFIFLFLYVKNEISYDTYHEKADRIYRIESDFYISGNPDRFAIVPVPMAHALKIEYPEVESFVRFNDIGRTSFTIGNKEYFEDDFYFADSTVFDVFTHKMLMGDPDKSLVEPNSVVLTQSVAKKYFADENPMGKIIESESGRNYKVTGVIEDLPRNSHLRFDALLSASTMAHAVGEDNFNSMEPGRFWNIGVYSYVLLNENASIQSIHDKFEGFYDKYMKPIGDQINGSFNLMSTPLHETHFVGGLQSDLPKGNMTYVYIFAAVALLILMLAAINYMNMATARSAKRSREVGIRKVAGAFRAQLIWQFIGESLMITFLALLIALLLVYILLPDFVTLSGKALSFNIFTDPVIFIVVILVSLLVGIGAGSYPAFYLSSFRPVSVIKGAYSGGGKKGGGLRKILVVFQFWIAISMIIATIVVSDQIKFLMDKDVGFKKENLVILEIQDTSFLKKKESFKEELLQNPNITHASYATGIPGETRWVQVVRVEVDTAMVEKTMVICIPDYDYLKTYDIKLDTGRFFLEDMGTDWEAAVVVNQAAVKAFGWGNNALGKKINWGFDLQGDPGRIMKVVGVLKDYNFRSLHNEVQPMMMFMHREIDESVLSLRLTGKNFQQTLDFVGEKWRAFGSERPFDYRILENTWDEMYEAEKKLGTIFTIATLLAIFIALLGLLGLSSFIAERRTKEIGIRKVLGATIPNILGLLYREFLILISIAFVIAVPVTWWRLSEWLETSFVYHTGVSWYAIILAGLYSVLIGIVTISFHSLKAALSNPVDAIKYE
ncbi:MAG: ABC transporter permease [Bacteroidota bacterium]|nr:ABC transporter permease [Bacteroidota bacterium]